MQVAHSEVLKGKVLMKIAGSKCFKEDCRMNRETAFSFRKSEFAKIRCKSISELLDDDVSVGIVISYFGTLLSKFWSEPEVERISFNRVASLHGLVEEDWNSEPFHYEQSPLDLFGVKIVNSAGSN